MIEKEVCTPLDVPFSVSGRLDLFSLTDDKDGLEIKLEKNGSGTVDIIVKFKLPEIIGYRLTNDSYSWKTLAEREWDTVSRLVVVSNSKYIKWLNDEVCGVWDFDKAKHYALMLGDDGIDVVSFGTPEIIKG